MRYFDMHCDTLEKCLDENKSLEKNEFDVDIKRLDCFDKAVQFFACFIDDKYKDNDAYVRYVQMYSCFRRTDFGKVKPVLTVENLSCIDNNIENLYLLKGCGVKVVSLTWNGYNGIAGGVNSQEGLSDFGKIVVSVLENIGITIDVSHLNEKSFYDICNIATKPFIATHSNSYEVCNNKRNLKDEQIKLIKQSGGLIGINFYKDFVGQNNNTFEDILRHIEHIIELTDEKILGLGSDFDGCETHPSVAGVQSMPSFYDFLVKKLSKQVADSIIFENCNEFFKIF